MNVDRKTREELNALSQEVFGSSSRWHKLVTKGVPELLTEEIDEILPNEKEGEPDTVKQVKVAIRREDGSHLSVMKYFTVDTIREYMLARKVQLDLFKVELARLQEEARAKKEAEKLANTVHQAAGGSVN